MACETARAARVGQLALFHHDPNYDDQMIAAIEQQAQKLFPGTLAAREGLTLSLLPQEQELHHAPTDNAFKTVAVEG